MPIAAREQPKTTEEKFDEIIRIINNIRSPQDRAMINSFIMELCQRYIGKDKELQGFVSPSVKAMNAFETEYIERILREFGYRD